MENVILYVFLLAALIQAIFYLLVFTPILLPQNKVKNKNNANLSNSECIPLSVIICAKNEKDNLTNHLPLILAQKYPNFEVIVVDDGSSDGTSQLLIELQEKYETLKIFTLEPDKKVGFGKKEALTLGISMAQHEWLVMTDADCVPASAEWLKLLSEKMTDEKEMVLGVGLYEKKWTLLNMLIRFETILVALQYLNFAEMGMPYMGVGRNIAYKKSLFNINGGFEKHKETSSGDDDLFVNAVATSQNCTFCMDQKAFTYSLAPQTWKDWIRQKERHYTTGKKYKFGHQITLSFFLASKWLFWVMPFYFLFANIWNPQIQGAILGTFFAYCFVMAWASIKFKEQLFWFFIPILDFLLILFIIPLGIKSTFFSKNKWA
jgi:cellulose synthase/poly-beta-1,6-N-acetylglucosamine synthase-like glycosyltransferase